VWERERERERERESMRIWVSFNLTLNTSLTVKCMSAVSISGSH